MLTYITAFLDIGRGDWGRFKRTPEDYFRFFQPLLDMFLKNPDNDYNLIVYLDKKFLYLLPANLLPNIHIIEIDEEIMNTISPLWRRLPREKEILDSDIYKNTFSHRLQFPENSNPKYTLINHVKVDFIYHAIHRFPERDNEAYYCWVDFGYFQDVSRIPKNFIDLNLIDKEKVNYTLINPLDNNDTDIMYTMNNAPERIGGFFFLGSGKVLIKYRELYHQVHEWFQNNNLVDDDQHLALRCYFLNPELFYLHNLGGWHRALIAFEKK